MSGTTRVSIGLLSYYLGLLGVNFTLGILWGYLELNDIENLHENPLALEALEWSHICMKLRNYERTLLRCFKIFFNYNYKETTFAPDITSQIEKIFQFFNKTDVDEKIVGKIILILSIELCHLQTDCYDTIFNLKQ